jgi:hypothetical protein
MAGRQRPARNPSVSLPPPSRAGLRVGTTVFQRSHPRRVNTYRRITARKREEALTRKAK